MRRTESLSRCSRCWISASSARIPPSPSLSARMMKKMYLTVTTIVSAHTISESTPKTFSGVGGTAATRRPAGIDAEALLHRVERARPDVAVDDAERREREQRESLSRRIRLEHGPLAGGWESWRSRAACVQEVRGATDERRFSAPGAAARRETLRSPSSSRAPASCRLAKTRVRQADCATPCKCRARRCPFRRHASNRAGCDSPE